MLLKSKDDVTALIDQMDSLLQEPLAPKQKEALRLEKAMLLAGRQAEQQAAYEIDFRLKNHKEWLVIHDLRLEYGGRVAQIDHLLFTTNWEFYVVETKNVKHKLKIENDHWSRLYGRHWQGMPSPIEQNNRHILLLKAVLNDLDLLPKTLGLPITPRFINVVLVPSNCSIRKREEHAWVLHMDEFVSKARWDLNLGHILLNLVNTYGREDSMSVGRRLVSLHKPFQIDYRERFGIASKVIPDEKDEKPSGKHCDLCEEPMNHKEVFFCRINKPRFAGKLLCQKCQAYAPNESIPVKQADDEVVAFCDECKRPITQSVLEQSSLLPGNQVCCSVCQQLHPAYIAPERLRLDVSPVPVLCQQCTKPVTSAENAYSQQHFGKILCRSCQKSPVLSEPLAAKVVAKCELCGGGVDAKVRAFCRFNSKKMDGKVLCRNCQPKPPI